jgi:hypothetical protein
MSARSWLQRVQGLLDELKGIDFGYPLGVNSILAPPTPGALDERLVSAGLESIGPVREFYSCCDGISLPDVHIGYFIKPSAKLPASRPDSEPNTITGPIAGKVVTIGSTGGGDLFALRLPESDVLYLPPGPLRDGTYDDSGANVRRLAPDFCAFLELLLGDIEAFVKDESHHFIV